MEEYKKKPLGLNEQERVLGWERGIKLVMQGHGLERTNITESTSIARMENKRKQQEHKEMLDKYTNYARSYDENIQRMNYWADRGRNTNNKDDWYTYDKYKQRLEIPEGCEEIHYDWTGFANEYRKIEDYEKKEERFKRDERREIEAVGKVMQAIIETTSAEVYRKYARIIDQPEGDRIKRLFKVIEIIKDTLAGAVAVQKARWRNTVQAIPMANTIQELESLMDNLEYIKTSVESEEQAYPGSNPFAPQDWKTILETKISADGDMTIVYGQVLNMPETTTLGEICKALKTTVIDKYRLKRIQQPAKGLKDELQVLATRIELMEKDKERDRRGGRGGRSERGRSYDRGRSYSREDTRYDRGRGDGERYDQGKGRKRERSQGRFDRDRGRSGDRRGERERSGDRRNRYREEGSQQCYEYQETGKCGYKKRTGYTCRLNTENQRRKRIATLKVEEDHRGRSYDRGRSPYRGDRQYDRVRERGGNDRIGERARLRTGSGDDRYGRRQCYEYQDTGKCEYKKS